MLTSLFSFLALVSVAGSYKEDEMSLLFFLTWAFYEHPFPNHILCDTPDVEQCFSRETSP